MRDRGIPFRRAAGGPAAGGPGERGCQSSASDRTMLFIVGCARSGTTWVRSIFAAHARVVTGPESHLFPTLYGPFAGKGMAAKRRAAALDTYDRWARGEIGVGAGPHRWVSRERLCELLDELVLDTNDDAVRALGARTALGTILEEFAAASGADLSDVLVEKTPLHLYYAKTILEWWSAARVVELIRDGRDVCVSLQHKSEGGRWAPADRRDQINRWVQAVGFGAAAREQPLAQGRWLPIYYEALSSDTHEQVRRLFAFAGLPVEDHLIDHIVATTGFSAPGATDPLQHRRKGVVGDHRNHFSEADHKLFREVAGDVFEAAGYRF
jgi:Sulfotransferase family